MSLSEAVCPEIPSKLSVGRAFAVAGQTMFNTMPDDL